MRAVGFVPAIAAMFLAECLAGFLAGFLADAASPRLALAQNDYPSRPVSLIVPYAAGGVADVAMRLLGDKLLVQAPAASGLPHPQGIAGNTLHAATVTAAEPSGLVVAFLGRESDNIEPTKPDAH